MRGKKRENPWLLAKIYDIPTSWHTWLESCWFPANFGTWVEGGWGIYLTARIFSTPRVMVVTQILESLIGVRQRKLRARLTHSFRHPSQHPGWVLAPSDNGTVEHYGTGSRKKNQISEKSSGKFYFDILTMKIFFFFFFWPL